MKRQLLKALLFILITLLMISNSASFAQANKTKSSNSTKQEEDIRPPDGEKWYETGDENIYRFIINPEIPNTGITGGLFIYYGHFIRPPYRIEIKNSEVYINGLIVYPPHNSFTNKLAKIKRERFLRSYKLSNDEKKIMLLRESIIDETKEYVKNLQKKYKPMNKERFKYREELRKYLSNHPLIIEFYIYETGLLGFDFNIKGDDNKYTFSLTLEEEERNYTEKEITDYKIRELNEEKKSWENDLSKILYFFYPQNNWSYRKKIEINKINKILLDEDTREKKIKKLFIIFGNIDHAKLIYYNYDLKAYNKWVKKNEK